MNMVGNQLFGAGSDIFGYEKSKSKTQQESEFDYPTKQLQEIKKQGLIGSYLSMMGYNPDYAAQIAGPYGSVWSSFLGYPPGGIGYNTASELYRLGPETEGFRQRYLNSISAGLTPEDWVRAAQTSSGVGLQTGLNLADPTAATAAAQQYLQNIVTPGVQNQYTLMGLGSSGALGEALTRQGAALALPIAQQTQAQRAGMGQQYAEQLHQIMQQYPNAEVTLRDAMLGRLREGMTAADVPRQLQVQDLQRRTGLFSGLFSQTPYMPSQGSKQTQTEYGNWLMDIVAPIAMAAMGGGMGGMMGGMGGMSAAPMPSMGGMGGMGGGSSRSTPPPAIPNTQQYVSPYPPAYNQMYGAFPGY